jgi:exodeoxyribonuclease VII small subunit
MAEKPPAPDAGLPSFELALARLEEIVEQLEQGSLELEGALAVFEEGVRLSRHCAAQLSEAERRIEVLLRDGDELRTRPLDEPDER